MYVSKNGKRSANCGSREQPCGNIADVLLNRHQKISVYLESESSAENEYELLLPLTLFAAVTFKSYPENSSKRPIITTDQPILFIICNNQSFTVDNVDFRLLNEGVLLEIDSDEHLLENITLKNTKIRNDRYTTIKYVHMKSHQSITHINVENVDIPKGSLVEIKGNKHINTTTSRNINIGHLDVYNVNIEKIISFDNTFGRCNITKVNIHDCKIDFGLYVVNSICQICLISIYDTEIKHTAVNVMKHKQKATTDKDAALTVFRKLGRYLKNLPSILETENITETGKNIIKRIQIERCTMTTAIEVSNMDVPFTINSVIIRNSSMKNSVEITETSFEANHVVIVNNSITRNIYQQKRGDLKLDNLIIKYNSKENIKALVYEAGTNTSFTLTNATIEWKNVKNTHPPLVDIYLGDGYFSILNVSIISHSIYGVILLAIEIGNKATSRSVINSLKLDCTRNSNSTYNIEDSIRGKIMYTKCDPCDTNTYTQQKSFNQLGMKKSKSNSNASSFSTTSPTNVSVSMTLFDKVKVLDRRWGFKCHNCPIGGSCKNGIRSSGNFYGYSRSDGTVDFTACPKNYCCSKKQCIDVDSCKFSRVGVLCGSCPNGFQEDLSSENCIEIKKCKKENTFWALIISVTMIVCVIILYLKEILTCGKYIYEKLKAKFKSKVKQEDKNKNIKQTTDRESEEKKDERKFTVSGCLNIIVGFYQIRSLLTVDIGEGYERANTYQEEVTKVMNLYFSFGQEYCPWKRLTPIGEGFIINQLATLLILGWALFILFVYFIKKRIINLFSDKNGDKKNSLSVSETLPLSFSQRVGIGIIRIIMFGYKSVATFAIVMVHCVDIKGDSVMFINGDIKCHTPLQYASYALIILWVIPFPAALMKSYQMYMTDKTITMGQLVVSLIFPWIVVYYWLTRRCCENNNWVKRSSQEESRNKNVRLMLHEMFQEAYRKRKNKDEFVFWETWRLYQRLVLAAVTTYAINPVERICYIAPLILFFHFVYSFVKPYKKNFVVLHWMELIGLLGITFTLVNNMFRSFLYVFEIPNEKPVPQSLLILWILDTFASPIFVPVFMYVWLSIDSLLNRIFDQTTPELFNIYIIYY